MTPSCIAALIFFCLLLLLLRAQHGASAYHTSYKIGSRQIFYKTPAKPEQASTVPPPTCSSIASAGLGGNNKLPVVHRLSPCSPFQLQGLPSLTAADVLRRDTHRLIRRRSAASQSSAGVAAPAPAPAAATIPTNGSSDPVTLPGALDYSVLVSYGMPAQQFPMFLDTIVGASLLRCKPCASGSGDCDPAFDTSRSSTFTQVPCGSPECPTTNCSGSACPFDSPYIPIEGSFARDVLTLAPSSTAVHDFRFACLHVARPSDLPEAGSLDLSRDSNSLPSRLSPSSLPAFSYCLSPFPGSQGFLSLGGDTTTVRDDNRTVFHAPLVSNDDPELASMYFIDLVGMSLGGEDLPIPAGTFGNGGTNLDVGTTFTLLPPAAYTPLRDAFRKQMSHYNRSLPGGFAGFDTCYNFTGMHELVTPILELKFGNSESLEIHMNQILYYDDPASGFSVSCLAFSALDAGEAFSVIGTYTLASTEVVYDVAGGKVGFIPESC